MRRKRDRHKGRGGYLNLHYFIRGYPRIFNDPDVGPEAKKVFADAQAMLKLMIDHKLLQARAVVGLYPANSVGDGINVRDIFFGFVFYFFTSVFHLFYYCILFDDQDIELYSNDTRTTLVSKVHGLRQQAVRVCVPHHHNHIYYLSYHVHFVIIYFIYIT